MRYDDPKSEKVCYFRSDTRVFMQNGAWFFATREGDQGPFVSRERAFEEMARYVRVQNDHELRHFKHTLAEERAHHDAHSLPHVASFEPSVAAVSGEFEFDLVPMSVTPPENRR